MLDLLRWLLSREPDPAPRAKPVIRATERRRQELEPDEREAKETLRRLRAELDAMGFHEPEMRQQP